ncbi:MAG: hypothetical protein PF450_02555 [Bacteroidales bacterium]|jgi:hypothetical protein|nr:hypothetical protein [Bacteroidales bacterium]
MKFGLFPFFSMVLLVSSCSKDPIYTKYSEHLTGEIEKEWHLDSVSIQGDKSKLEATPECVSDDQYIFRYENTYTYFNNQTEFMLIVAGMGCGEQTIFDIRIWEIVQDTMLDLNGTPYIIDKLTEDEMVLKLKNELLEYSEFNPASIYDFKFFYARVTNN